MLLMISFFLQETWLTFEELPMLKSVPADFYADGITAMDTSSGLILGSLLAALPSCGVNPLGIVYKYTSIMAIEYNDGNRKLLAVNIYTCLVMTHSANYDEFINYLGMMHAIIHDCDISSVYIIGDWNAGFNGNSVFGTELSSFCLEHDYVLSDIDHLGAHSGSFTFVSEAHGTTSWLDHCLCTTQAHASLVDVNIDYGMQSSDHFPLSIILCIDVKSVPRLDSESVPSPGLNGAKRRLGTSQRTQINVQNCLVILSSHGRPSVAVTPRVKMVVILRTSSVCIIISLTVYIVLLRIVFLVRSQTASEIKTSPLGGTTLLKLHTLKPETLLNFGLDPVNLDMVRCLKT